MNKMTSNQPYLLRAIYDWLVDNNCTPHIMVNARYPGVAVPQQFVSDGQIVLNVAPRAVQGFVMDLEAVAFSTRFGGVPTEIFIPVKAIMGIYARENGHGMMFGVEEFPEDGDAGDEPPTPPTPARGGRPSLKVVK
jgi:stringent starvation protein B